METLHEAANCRILRQTNLTQAHSLASLTTITNMVGGRTLVAIITQPRVFVSHVAKRSDSRQTPQYKCVGEGEGMPRPLRI
jgi:hypothetical protein